jgi:hypothetical protein
MKKQSAVIWITVIAVSFLLLGILADRYLLGSLGGGEPTVLERLTRDLDLTNEQKIKIGGFLDDEDAAIERIVDSHRESFSIAVRDVRDDTRAKIRGVLDETQAEIFDSGGFFSK